MFFSSRIILHLHWTELFSVKCSFFHHCKMKNKCNLCKMQLISNGLFSYIFFLASNSEMFPLTSLMAMCVCQCVCGCVWFNWLFFVDVVVVTFSTQSIERVAEKMTIFLTHCMAFALFKWHARYFYLWVLVVKSKNISVSFSSLCHYELHIKWHLWFGTTHRGSGSHLQNIPFNHSIGRERENNNKHCQYNYNIIFKWC